MPELALPTRIEGADPRLDFIQIAPPNVQLPGNGEAVIFTPSGQGLWRVRSVNITGALTGTMGTNSIGLDILAGVAPDWANRGLQYVSQVDYDFAFDDSFAITWSTEVGASYGGKRNINVGRVFNVALPLLFIAETTGVAINNTKNAGSDADAYIDNGSMQVEYFPPGSVGIGDDAGGPSLYLLGGTG